LWYLVKIIFFVEKQKHDYFSFYLFKFLWVFSFDQEDSHKYQKLLSAANNFTQ